MKKNLLRFAIVLFVSVIAFSGCKKGDDDPFISLRSRTARLAGDWKLSGMDYTSTSTSTYSGTSYTTTTKVTYSGTVKTSTSTTSGQSNTTTTVYTETLTIEKDGTFSGTVIDDGDASTYAGNWMWVKKNKSQDLKNKEAVIMTMTNYTGDGDSDTYSGKSNSPSDMWVIKKLANKELVILYDYTHTDSDGYSYSRTGTITYTQD